MRHYVFRNLLRGSLLIFLGFIRGEAQPLERFLEEQGLYVPDHMRDSLEKLDPFMGYQHLHDQHILPIVETIIPKYYEQGKLDSIAIVLELSRYRFPYSRTALDVFDILLNIQVNKIEEINLRPNIWELLTSFRSIRRSQTDKEYISWRGREDFCVFVEKVAGNLAPMTTSGSSANFVTRYIVGDHKAVLTEIQSPEYRGLPRRRYYYQTVAQELSHDAGGQFAIFGGSWLPFGANKRLGNHPEVGALYGFRFGQTHFELIYSQRFGRSKSPYVLPGDQAGDSTRSFRNSYIGIDVGKLIVRKRTWDCSAVAGMGAESMDSASNSNNRVVNRIDINVGLRQRLFIGKNRFWYVGVQERFHPFYFRNSGGTDLSGSSVSITLMFGLDVDHGLIGSRRTFGYRGWRDAPELAVSSVTEK